MAKNFFSLLLLIVAGVIFTPAQREQTVSFDSADLSRKARQAYLRLLKAEKFSVGHTGYTGERTDEDEALHMLLKNKKSVSALKSLVETASPEGRLYGLFGLRIKDKSAYRKALQNLNQGYEPPERTSFWGVREIDGSGVISAGNLDKGVVGKGTVVIDMRGLIRLRKWNEIINDIETGVYDDLFERR